MHTGTKLASSAIRSHIEFVVYSAATLARQAEPQSAQELLLTVPDKVATAEVFDLRARIYAQQGKYGDAEGQWRQAIQRDPANREYELCLREAERRRLHPASFLWKYAIGGVLILVAIAASLRVWQGTQHQAHVITRPPSSSVAQEPKSESPTELRFSGPLFSSGTRFTRAGLNQIRETENQLRVASRIDILGQTDSQQLKPGSKYRDNQELGLARASAVALVLHKDLGIPLTKMTVASGSLPDEGNRVPSSRDRRTAVIRIWHGGQ